MYEDLSKQFIDRLPRYYRYMNEFINNGVTYISSQEIAKKMGVTSSQIRNDMSKFVLSGQQGQGYNTQELIDEIAKVLGLDITKKVIMIGAGNIGRALIKHRMFQGKSFKLIGVFDIKDIDDIAGYSVLSVEAMPEFIQKKKPDIAVIAVPSHAANETAQTLISLGVKGILNFSNEDINSPHNTVIQNIHIRDNLMILSHKISHFNNND